MDIVGWVFCICVSAFETLPSTVGVSMDSLGQASRFYLRLLCLKTTDCCWRRWVIISFCLFLAFKSKSIRVFLTDVTSCWLPPRMSGMKIILLCSLWSLGPVGQILITRASVTERNIFIFFLSFFFCSDCISETTHLRVNLCRTAS